MAIEWFDLSASTNGNGTYASPWNGTTNYGTGSAGDEIRIKGHSIADMTDFTFTATFFTISSNYLNPRLAFAGANNSGITAGDILMQDSTKTCCRVDSVSADTINMYAGFEFRPVFGWNYTGTWRRIKPEYYPLSSNRIYLRPSGSSGMSNTTVSDGWSSETTRHDDKSYMTICGTNPSYFSTVYVSMSYYGPNSTVDLSNSCYVASSGRDIYLQDHFNSTSNSTFHLHQLYGGRWNGGVHGASSAVDNEILVDYMSTYYGPSSSGAYAGQGNRFEVKNHIMYNTYQNTRDRAGSANHMITNNVWAPHLQSVMYDYSHNPDWTWEFNGRIEGAGGNVFYALIHGGKKLTIGPNFGMSTFNYNSTPTEAASIQYWVYLDQTKHFDWDLTNPMEIVNNSSLYAHGASMYFSPRFQYDYYSTNRAAQNKVPIHNMKLIYNQDDVYINGGFPSGSSALKHDIKTGAEAEWLSPPTMGSPSYGLRVYKDHAGVNFKYTQPSLRFYAPSYSPHYANYVYVKAVDLPVSGNGTTQFNVTGWVKSESGFLAPNGLEARVTYNHTEKASVSLNIAAIEAGWTQFSIPFTPSGKEIVQFTLRVNMHAGSKQLWLSDLVVT